MSNEPTLTKPTAEDCVPCAELARRRAAAAAIQPARPADYPKNAPVYVRQPQPSREYEAHLKRNERRYSEGHRRMYQIPAEMLMSGGDKVSVLEVGFGIGYGLGVLRTAGIVGDYYGLEPDADSFDYTAAELVKGSELWHEQRAFDYNAKKVLGDYINFFDEDKGEDLHLWRAGFLELVTRDEYRSSEPIKLPACDYSFMIEVIEHIPALEVPKVLSEIRKRTLKLFFMSTPDATTSTHGVATAQEWERVLMLAGFKVVKLARHWTTLYICEPRG